MEKRKCLIAGNWKMNGTSLFTKEMIHYLLENVSHTPYEIALFPPYIYLSEVNQILKNSFIQWGAQDLSVHENGAYTGDISASMLVEVGCRYVIVGHSERRTYHHESNELIAKKALMACQHQLTPLVCLGETLSEREQNLTYSIITAQLEPLLASSELLSHCVIAYEPVWAIGTGKTATSSQAQEVHHFIRQAIAKKAPSLAQEIRILYGGSVKSDNAADLFNMPDIDGGLIGGASLKKEEFAYLCQIEKSH